MGSRAYLTIRSHKITVQPGQAVVSLVFPMAIAESMSNALVVGRNEAIATQATMPPAPTDAELAAARDRMESVAAMLGRAIAEADILGRNAAHARGIALPGVAATPEVH